MRAYELNEDKEKLKLPDIIVGDEVKVGRFKNRKAIVKGFKKDDHNQPVLKTTKGDQKLFKPRISKLEPKNDKGMTEEKEILRDYKEHGLYGGWISDKNKIFGTDTEQAHLELINKLGFASFESAFEAGWVRIIWKDHGWYLEGMPKDIKRSFRKIAKRFFKDAKDSEENFTLQVDLLSDPMIRYEDVTSEYFIMPQERVKLIQFMNGL